MGFLFSVLVLQTVIKTVENSRFPLVKLRIIFNNCIIILSEVKIFCPQYSHNVFNTSILTYTYTVFRSKCFEFYFFLL